MQYCGTDHAPDATELGGEYILRLAIGAATIQKRHIDAFCELLSTKANDILSQTQPNGTH